MSRNQWTRPVARKIGWSADAGEDWKGRASVVGQMGKECQDVDLEDAEGAWRGFGEGRARAEGICGRGE